MKKTGMRIFSLFLMAALAAGCASVNLKEGKKAYEEMRYSDAIWYLEKGLEKKDDPAARSMLADAYRITGNNGKAVEVYSQTNLAPGTSDTEKINYARTLMSEGQYFEAKNILEGVLSRDKTNQEAQSLLLSCKKQDELRRDSIMYVVTPVNIPSSDGAFSPVVSGNGLFITMPKSSGDKDPYTSQSFTDIFFTSKSGETWSEPVALKGVNSPWHDASPVVSPNGQIMVFTRNFMLQSRALGSNEQDQSTTQLYMSRRDADGNWSKAEMLPFCDARYMFAHPAFSPDGSVLYFASDMKGTSGGLDLYESRFADGSWGAPKNLGNDVNTKGDECFPTMRDADTLYYSSDSHETIGGLDLIYSIRKDGIFGRPTHLSYPINSQRDDFGLVYNSPNTGYFSSNRTGSDRIYSFTIEKPVLLVNGLVTGQQSQLPL
ncbi:MAG: PD40 domain-containing protein, partial [Flavobacteriales bacterium]|nr:PD40 domain-containing protein [Flavobacteriales bacterium]